MRIKSICYAGGKSAGHLMPCITKAQQMYSQGYKTIIFFTADTALDKTLIQQAPFPVIHIPLSFSKSSIFFISSVQLWFKMALNFFKALKLLLLHKPEKIISSGGIYSIPVCAAAYILRIPIHLFEPNAVPGKAIRLLSWISTTIEICFPETSHYFQKNKCIIVDYPIRFSTQELQSYVSIKKESNSLHKKNKLLILGGSQGSQTINTLLMKLFTEYDNLSKNWIITHQTGIHQLTIVTDFYKKLGIEANVFSYSSSMHFHYQDADLIIARAGAGTIFEIAAFKKKGIIIPLEGTADNHQINNAYAFINNYPAAVLLRQNDKDILYSLYVILTTFH